tara:strand:+ start:1153 stop:2940 length:1788 start_codon:yes stop_codon:yes gene_type:complete
MTAVRGGAGAALWGQIPRWDASDAAMYAQQPDFSDNYVLSANQPLTYQVIWTASGVTEDYPATVEGDMVNCLFTVLGTTEYPLPASPDWDTLAVIRKSKDIPNTNIVNLNTPSNQRFTIDVSRIVQDQLSYTLVPIGKGSFQNQEFGGMNGGVTKQDNITEQISPYNVTRSGAYRAIKVTVDFEVLNANLELVLSSTALNAPSIIRAINSVSGFDSNTYYDHMFVLERYVPTLNNQKRALTNCPNNYYNTTNLLTYKKSVRDTDQAEWLYFYVRETVPAADPSDRFNLYEMYGETYTADGTLHKEFVIGSRWRNRATVPVAENTSDLSHCFEKETALKFAEFQNQIAVQNVSPAYIDANAFVPQNANYPYAVVENPFNDTVTHYKVHVRGVFTPTTGGWDTQVCSNTYWYKIDRQEEKSVYEHVKFHWLNPMGGIDSYIATRNVLESISVDKSLITKNLPSRTYHQSDDSGTTSKHEFYNDGMRGWNTYKGGQEVLNIEANINNKVYTEPLNAQEANWLREIFTSPNVWIETSDDTSQDAATHENLLNPDLRPVTIKYTPVILTNSEIVSLDQENGLVQFNIEYTLSQGLPTQRN